MNRGCSAGMGHQEWDALCSSQPTTGLCSSPGRGRILPQTHHPTQEHSPATLLGSSSFCALLWIKKKRRKKRYLNEQTKPDFVSRSADYLHAGGNSAPHPPNNSAGHHLSPALQDDQSNPVSAAHKFTSGDNVLCERERKGGEERERESKTMPLIPKAVVTAFGNLIQIGL